MGIRDEAKLYSKRSVPYGLSPGISFIGSYSKSKVIIELFTVFFLNFIYL